MEDLKTIESAQSHSYRGHDNWEPDFVFGYFHGVLRCFVSHCRETAVVGGDMKVGGTAAMNDDYHYYEILKLRHILPPPPVIELPDGCPTTVADRIGEAAGLLFVDPSAAGNRIRIAVEELLTAQKIRRFTHGRKGRLSAHARIRLFRDKNDEAAQFLEAVKWIGNDASHDVGLSAEAVIDGLELLEHALKLIYNDRSKSLARRVKSINRRRTIKSPTSRKSAAPN
ncbi:DUF4145 domain-containing protein [Micromonospora sp. RTP1Z1]|uniref:DUF4145 domain-containing protein n=1 Tax=Micromonospora sp. RTP1Z1 TaxID=2994043 RepID=UPI0029C6CC08|nr:DUF4145 domain-containing protein [Micromonospora sp. RTP1Z1]